MNILIDTSPLENKNSIRGVGRYTQELVTALRKIRSPHAITTTAEILKNTIDLVHYPYFDLFFPTLPMVKRAKTVVTIHDVIPLLFPNQYHAGIRGTFSYWRQRFALASVSAIITDSLASKRDIIDHLHVASDKVHVVYLACPKEIARPAQAILDAVRKKFELPRHFLLYVGDINYNKNIPFLLSVLKKMPKVSLVMVGKNVNNKDIPEGQAIEKTIHGSDLERRVYRITTVDTTQELSALYSLADAYIQPSLYEGFGLPVLEAMQCKTPVICSRGGSLPEVAGDYAVYFHPVDSDECAQAIQKVLHFSDKQRLVFCSKAFEHSQQFSWERTARDTIAVYESV